MPLLNKKPFHPNPVPSDLDPDEEVFVCQPTKEVFRDYEQFFNRHFLCNSLVWTCELTGQTNLTYTQALESEKEAKKLLDSLPESLQKAALNLVHHTRRTNLRTLADEICAFYRQRFVQGECLDMMQSTTSGAKIVTPVNVLKVIPPQSKSPHSPCDLSPVKSPVRVPVITLSPFKKPLSPPPSLKSPPPLTTANHDSTLSNNVAIKPPTSAESAPPTQNGLPPHTNSSPGESTPAPSSSGVKAKTPRTPSTPLSPEVTLDPAEYRYIVVIVDEPDSKIQVKGSQLVRSKGVLSPRKLKMFLRNALHRMSEKHPFAVKDEYVQKFALGPSSVDFAVLPSPVTKSSRKRSLSQVSIDSFLTPGATTLSERKKSRPTSLGSAEGKSRRKLSGKKTPKTSTDKSKKKRKTKSVSKTPKSPKASMIFPKMSGSPRKKSPTKSPHKTPKSPKTPRSKVEALKVLNKAKKFKQMDLKKNIVNKKTLSEEEMAEMKRISEEERRLRMIQRELEKQIKKEERLQKIREQQEQRRLEKLRQKEWLKPREDLLCENSKPLPMPTPVKMRLPPELFGEAVMVMEFLHSFGPLFNIKEIIRGGIGFDDIEYAVMTEQVDSFLYEIIKFLLQAIFVAMEEEYEDHPNKDRSKKTSKTTSEEVKPADSLAEDDGETISEEKESENVDQEKMEEGADGGESHKDQEEGAPVFNADNEMDAITTEETKPLDVRIQGIITSAMIFSSWTRLTQHISLNEMVLNPYTCSEVLRLHLLSSGGYAETGDRNWFRHSRRGGFSDSDEPAIALRLQRPDIFDSLARSSIFSLSSSDKLQILSTLCSQLLTYSVAREYIDEASIRAKNARKKIREIQFSEERRKKEEKAALHKIKMEKARLKKQQEAEKKKPDSTVLASSIVPATTLENDSDAQTTGNPSTVLPADAPKDEKMEVTESLSKHEEVSWEDSGDRETEEEHKARIDEELFKLNEELIEADVAINVKPLGCDRYHRNYWMFPSLPGLYVEDTRPEDTLAEQQKQLNTSLKQESKVEDGPHATLPNMAIELSQKLLSPGAVLVKSEPNPLTQIPVDQNSTHKVGGTLNHQVINLTTPSPSKPLPPPLIHISDLPLLMNKDPACDREVTLKNSNDSAASTPGTQTPTTEVSCQETPAQQSVDEKPTMDQVSWSCYMSPEDIATLLESLNARGLREVELKKTLEVKHLHLEPNLSKCPFSQKSSQPTTPQAKYDSANEYLELYLREQILDIEEKIHIGNLGYLREVDSRAEWRDMIENSGAAAKVTAPSSVQSKENTTLEGTSQKQSTPVPSHSRSVSPWPAGSGGEHLRRGNVTPLVDPSVRQLSKALLNIQAGIEKKYLMFPLGVAFDQKKRQKNKDKRKDSHKESDTCLQEWRASLAKATSFSQIFVHLATLERAVMWSRSLMNVRCRICRRKCGDEFLLLCDGCDHGYHTYCLKPPLKNIPEGDWFCYECQPVTPIKPRRVKRVVFIEEEESSESEAAEESQESDDNEEGEQSDDNDQEQDSEQEETDGEAEELGVATRRSLRATRSRVETPAKTATRKTSTRRVKQRASAQQNSNKKFKQVQSLSEPIVKRGRGRPPKNTITLSGGMAATAVAGRGRKNSQQNTSPKETCLARKKLKLDNLQSPGHHSKAESVIAAMIDLKCQSSKQRTSAGKREQKGLEMQLCEALWEEVNQQEESMHFALPIKKREYPDYFDLISVPMDLRTIKSKVKCSSYNGLDDFVRDMQLIFSNCLKYHKRHSDIGKAGVTLKRFFEKRCSDLGLKDLSLCGAGALSEDVAMEGVPHRMSTRRRH